MDLIFQFLRIMVFCFAGELCYNFLPLPIPASVYGLLLLLAALNLGWVKLEQVRTAALFLIILVLGNVRRKKVKFHA